MIKIRYIGKKPYRIVRNNNLIILNPGQIFQITAAQARKIKGSKFRRFFELVKDEPTVEERLTEIERLLNEDVRNAIINLRQRVTALEAHHP